MVRYLGLGLLLTGCRAGTPPAVVEHCDLMCEYRKEVERSKAQPPPPSPPLAEPDVAPILAQLPPPKSWGEQEQEKKERDLAERRSYAWRQCEKEQASRETILLDNIEEEKRLAYVKTHCRWIEAYTVVFGDRVFTDPDTGVLWREKLQEPDFHWQCPATGPKGLTGRVGLIGIHPVPPERDCSAL